MRITADPSDHAPNFFWCELWSRAVDAPRTSPPRRVADRSVAIPLWAQRPSLETRNRAADLVSARRRRDYARLPGLMA